MKRFLLGGALAAGLFTLYRLLGVWLSDALAELAINARFEDLTLLYAIMPGYFLAMSKLSQDRTRFAHQQLVPMLKGAAGVEPSSLVRLPVLLPGAVLGFLYGAWDMAVTGEFNTELMVLEWCLRIGNGLVWLSVGMIFAWRIHIGYQFYRLGQRIPVEPFSLERIRPVGRMAVTDVFIIMGAIALTPLQSLSTDFDMDFYRVAFLVAIVSSIIFLILPQLGVHQSARRVKRERLQRIQEQIDAMDPNQFVTMEALLAHRDRLREAPTWPTDTKGFSRAIFYLVVPPLAWVGAAIVEKGVDQFF